MPLDSLNGRSAILTGAAQGLGRAIAHAYAQQGMKVVLLDVLTDKLAAAADEVRSLGGEALPITVDLSDAAATQAAAERALTAFGTPCVLVHNAALLRQRSMQEVGFDQWRHELDIILQAAFI